MPFKTAQSAAEAFTTAKNLAAGVKATAQNAIAAFASNTSRDYVLELAVNLREWKLGLQAAAAVPGIAAYAQSQYADAGYNVASEFTAMVNAIDAVITSIVNAFPKSGTNEVLERVLNADGSITMRAFTPAQLSGLVTLLQTLSNTIST